MTAPVRKVIVDNDFATPWRFKANRDLFTQRIYFSNYAAATTTTPFDLTGFPGGAVIEGAFAMLNVPFTGGAVSAATFSLGTTASPASYIAATSVFTGATPTAPLQLVGLNLVPGTFLNATTPLAAGTIRAQLITTSANGNVLTAGTIDIFVRLRFPAYRAK